jgi:hypothetical protein
MFDNEKMIKLYENINKRYSYVGNCVNSFDSNTGECLSGIFSDVSDFGRYDELATCEDIEDSEGCGKISSKEFLSVVDFEEIPEEVKNSDNLEFYYYNNGVLVIYDLDEDIHYFFSR